MVPERIARAVKDGQVAIVAGFQGISKDDEPFAGRGDLTTAAASPQPLHADVRNLHGMLDGPLLRRPAHRPCAHRLRTLTQEET